MHEPYHIIKEGNTTRIVFGKICDHNKWDYIQDLKQVINENEIIVFDMINTEMIVSGWLRLLERLAVDIHNLGNTCKLENVKKSVRDHADSVGVGLYLWENCYE